MSKKPFVHLHFHSAYSLLDGACAVKKTMKRLPELGMNALALTDHGVLYGTIEFYKAARAAGIKPILGCEVYMAKGSMHEHQKGSSNHLVLLAENDEGFQNLSFLVSKAHLEGFYYKPRIDKELLAEHAKGLIALASCLKGEVTELCAHDRVDEATEMAGIYSDIMGPNNFFLEMQDHGLTEQRIANEHILEVARRTNLPIVATNDVHYIRREDSEAHEVMLCLQTGTTMDDPNHMKYGSDQFYLKSAEEMWDLFGEWPETLTNTVDIAERCNVKLVSELHFPTYEVPEDTTQKDYLIDLGYKGLSKHYGLEDCTNPKDDRERQIMERFNYELSIIERTGFINYFLVVWDFIHYAFEQDIPVGPGRGSGAGSLIAYALNITGIDPLKYNLIFERFLNPERVSPPDFDIDFCKDRREEVIAYVRDKYGRDSTGQIITFGTMGAKSVIRDVARVLKLPLSDADRIAKLIPDDPKMTLEKAIKESPDFRQACTSDEICKQIMKYAPTLEGLPRQPGTHAAGVVIGEKPLIEILPLARDKNKEVITQYEMKSLDDVGLLKMDFLGLRTLTVIKESVTNVAETKGRQIDPMSIPMDDPETFKLLNRGDTVGVFQVESAGMQDLLRRIGLTRFEDLIALIALYRPGPMNMLDDFVKRKNGQVPIRYDHPLLESILDETYGIMLYQEQVQQAANKLAGFSLGQGDILRRAMGKKKKEEMVKQRINFVDGCHKTNKISKALAEKIFAHIEQFAGYGFNKSHSTAYAFLSWHTAYFKAHHPAEFMAASLSSEMGNADKIMPLIVECQHMGLEVLPPNVNDSVARFKPVEGGVRFGLAGIKNVGAAAVEALVAEREANGPYKSLVDFCERIDGKTLNRKVLENLVKCGAFDWTGMSRGRLFEGIEFAMSRGQANRDDRASGQMGLFDMVADTTPDSGISDELPEAPPWSENVMLSNEKELLGFYFSGHPLKQYTWTLEHFCTHSLAQLDQMDNKTQVRTGGLVTGFQKLFTKKDQRAMGKFVLEGLESSIEVVVFPDSFERCEALLQNEQPVMVCGEFEGGDNAQIKAAEIYSMEQAANTFTEKASLHLPAAMVNKELILDLSRIVRRHPGQQETHICLLYSGGEKVFLKADHRFQISISADLAREIEHLTGEHSFYIQVRKEAYRYPEQHGRRKKWQRAAG